MCGRFTLRARGTRLVPELDVANPLMVDRYNIAPGEALIVVRRTSAGYNASHTLSWGLRTQWMTDPHSGLINARVETAAEKPAFRKSFLRRRCLVPADGFYEWARTPAGKTPYFFRFDDDRVFCFAGIWTRRQDPGAEPTDTVALLTTPANSLVGKVHDRMPVIIRPGHYERWMASETPLEAVLAMAQPLRDRGLVAYPVSNYVSNPKNKGEECVVPAGPVIRSE